MLHLRSHLSYLLPTVFLSLLAACGAPGVVPSDTDLVSLTLNTNQLVHPASAVRAQGVPSDASGNPVVNSVRVRVSETGTGTPVRFDDSGNEDPAGSREYIELTPGASSANVRLRRGTYSFLTEGFPQSSGGTLLAVGLVEGQAVGGSAPVTVSLPLHTVVGAFSLDSALPTTYVVPGQTLDLILSVQTDEAGGVRYPVPLDDLSVDYQVQFLPDPPEGSVLAQSKLGARVKVADDISTPDFTVTAQVGGWQSNDPRQAHLLGPASFKRPVYSVAQLGMDLTPPLLTIDSVTVVTAPPAFSQRHVVLTGQAGDNVAVTHLRVFEGPVQIGSTDDGDPNPVYFNDRGHPGNPAGRFGDWEADFFPTDAGTYHLTVVAQDAFGNETRATRDVTVP